MSSKKSFMCLGACECVFIRAFDLLTFQVIIDKYVLITISFIVFWLFLQFSSIPFFS